MQKTDAEKREPDAVKGMFARVAARYDIINRAMCFGLDVLWRRRLAASLGEFPDGGAGTKFADIACGSGDVALEILKRYPKANVVCADFCAPMLAEAEAKISKTPHCARAEFAEADCESLPFAAASFDGATISFGFRNFRDRKKCLTEIARVLKPNAVLAILEVSRAGAVMRPLQNFFMCTFVPLAAAALGGNRADYEYLARTTMQYPSNAEVLKMFADAGFKNGGVRKMGFGLVAITYGRKI